MFSGEVPLVTLFRERGQLEMGGEVIGPYGNGGVPALDRRGERDIDVAEGLFGGSRRSVTNQLDGPSSRPSAEAPDAAYTTGSGFTNNAHATPTVSASSVTKAGQAFSRSATAP